MFNTDNLAGVVREWWMHTPSSYWFLAERHTVTDRNPAHFRPQRTFHRPRQLQRRQGDRRMNRLHASMGLLIDRDQPLDFSFDGAIAIKACKVTLSPAPCLSNGRFLISRSFKYHRPRGPLTMAGAGRPTVWCNCPRNPMAWSDAHALSAGLQVTAQNVNGSSG